MLYDHALRLAHELNKVCPLIDCSLQGYSPAPHATAEQIAAARVVFNSFMLTDAAHEAWLTTSRRENLQTEYATGRDAAIARAISLILLQEVNQLRGWLRDLKTAVAGATNLASLQSRVAALPNTPDRTALQLHDAVKSKLADGSAD